MVEDHVMIMNNVAKIAVLETKVQALETELKLMDGKLDQLLHLQSKGQGAFWIASALFGTGLLGLGTLILNWFRGG